MSHKSLQDAAKPITAEELNALRREAKEFKKEGGDVALFWAGQMSSAAGKIPLASPLELSAILVTLDKVRREYDTVILAPALKKKA